MKNDKLKTGVGLPNSPSLASASGSVPPCPGGCDHTEAEHIAFDSGVLAGEKGQADSACPHNCYELQEAWLTGHSVGQQNRRAEAEAQNARISDRAHNQKTL